MSLVNIMFRSNRTFCFSQNHITYSVACLVTAWLVIVEGFAYIQYCTKFFHNNMSIIPYNHVSTVNIGWVIDVHGRRLCSMFSPLSLHRLWSFTSFKHSSFGETYFSKLFTEPLKNFRWLDPFFSKKIW